MFTQIRRHLVLPVRWLQWSLPKLPLLRNLSACRKSANKEPGLQFRMFIEERPMLKLTAICLALLLAGCESASIRATSSPFYLPPVGSKLILNQPLSIPAEMLSAYVQDGRPVFGANEYYPFCRFELRDLSPSSRVVQPDTFEIERVSRQTGVFAAIDKRRLIAALGLGVNLGMSDLDDGKPSPIVYGIRMDLRSARQPEVFRITCGQLQDPNMEAKFLSIDEIRQALGGVFTLQLTQ